MISDCTDFKFTCQIHKILEFQTSRQLESTNTTMLHTLALLGEQARALTLLSEQREKDSKAMKALTSVATLYLPATLVVAVFSSSLVQLLPDTHPRGSIHFVAGPQSWLPMVLIISLTAVTLITIRILERLYNIFK